MTPGEEPTCDLCDHARQHGWWGDPKVSHCGLGRGFGGSAACHRTWSRTSREAHCTVCHRHFGGATGFDRHFEGRTGRHVDPPGLVADEDGVWRQPAPQVAVSADGQAVSAVHRADPDPDTGGGC